MSRALLIALFCFSPCLTGMTATCSPIAPPPLPPVRSLQEVQDHSLNGSLFFGGGAAFLDMSGAGVGFDLEYRPHTAFGIASDVLIGHGGNDGVPASNTLFQSGLGVNLYMPVPRLKFHPLLLEMRVDATYLTNGSVTLSPSVGLTLGFYVWRLEFSATARTGLAIPIEEGAPVKTMEDSSETSVLARTLYIEADATIWVHIGPVAIGPFFRYLRSYPDWSDPPECEECEERGNFFGGGVAVRVLFPMKHPK